MKLVRKNNYINPFKNYLKQLKQSKQNYSDF